MNARTFRSVASSISLASWILLCAATPARAEGPPEAGPTPAAARPAGGDHSYDELEATARRLATNLGMPPDRREAALARLRTAFQKGKVAAFAGNAAVNGIFAYQMGEGGFLIKVKKGKGLAHLLGAEGQDLPLELKSVTFGAQVGGGSEWGFGLVLGLRAPAFFGGDYKGDTRGATAVEESVNITKLAKKGLVPGQDAYHELYLIGAASGLSAGAAIGGLTINVAH